MPKTRTLPLIMMVSAILAALASCADYSYTPPDTTGASGTVETGIHLQIPPVSGTTTSEYPVTIMCWNVLNFEKADAYAKIAAEISNHRVDILILCEVQNNDDDEARFTAALNAVGWSMPYHSLTRMSDNYNSLGIFSRYPITTATEILESDGPRSILKAVVVLTNDKTITLYGGHLKSGTTTYAYAQRKNQSLALANYVRANHPMLTNDYIAILGDMNTMGSATGDPVEDYLPGSTLARLCLRDDTDPDNDFFPVNYVFLPNTPTHNWPSLLDHIILSPAAASRYITGSVAVSATPWSGDTMYSDHRPVLVQLDMARTNSGEATPDGPSSVTLCTYNVEDFNLSNDSYNKIAAHVYNNGIDIIALQEVQPGDHPNDPTKWNDPNNAGDQSAFHTALQTAGSPMASSEFSSDGGLTYLYGDYLAFFSKYPLNATASILKGTYTDPVSGESYSMSSLRPVLYTTTRFGGRTLHLFNLHLKAQGFPPGSYPDDIKKRRAQAHALENHIKSNLNPVSDLIVILGDANTALTNTGTQGGDDFLEASTLGMLCLKSDNPGNTANDFIPMNVTILPADSWTHSVYTSRLDHIILSPAAYALYRPGSIKIVPHASGDPSDHLPIQLTLDAP